MLNGKSLPQLDTLHMGESGFVIKRGLQDIGLVSLVVPVFLVIRRIPACSLMHLVVQDSWESPFFWASFHHNHVTNAHHCWVNLTTDCLVAVTTSSTSSWLSNSKVTSYGHVLIWVAHFWKAVTNCIWRIVTSLTCSSWHWRTRVSFSYKGFSAIVHRFRSLESMIFSPVCHQRTS